LQEIIKKTGQVCIQIRDVQGVDDNPFDFETVKKKIEERNLARDKKNYELADNIRNELLHKGVLIEDKDGKTVWKFK